MAIDREALWGLIPEGQIIVLVGPSGCGKTTLLSHLFLEIEADVEIPEEGVGQFFDRIPEWSEREVWAIDDISSWEPESLARAVNEAQAELEADPLRKLVLVASDLDQVRHIGIRLRHAPILLTPICEWQDGALTSLGIGVLDGRPGKTPSL